MTRTLTILCSLLLVAWDYQQGIHATIIVPAALQKSANELGADSHDTGPAMFQCGLTDKDGSTNITHYITGAQISVEELEKLCTQLASLSKLTKPTLTTATTAAKTTWISDQQTALKAAGIIVVVDKPDWRTWIGRAEEVIKANGLYRINYPMLTAKEPTK